MRIARAAFALCVLAVAGGCPGVLAPSIDPVMWRCEVLSSPDPRVREEALAYLEGEFVEGSWVKYKHLTNAHRARLARCLPPLAQLLRDADPAIRNRVRPILWSMALHGSSFTTVDPAAATVVPALLHDAEHLWKSPNLEGVELRFRPYLLARDLDVLADYGANARAALPLAEAILAAPDVPIDLAELPPDALPRPLESVHAAARRLRWRTSDSSGPPR